MWEKKDEKKSNGSPTGTAFFGCVSHRPGGVAQQWWTVRWVVDVDAAEADSDVGGDD